MSTFPSASSRDVAQLRLQEWRARAEERHRLVAQTIGEKSPEEVLRLVQDLQVRQMELEMQYEQLLLAQQEAETLRTQYVDLYEFAPVGYCTLLPDGTITQLNLHCSQLLGSPRQQLLGRRFGVFVPLQERHRFADFLAQAFQTGTQETCELTMNRSDGSCFYAQFIALAIAGSTGQPATHCRLALLDTTTRHHAVAGLAASEARFRTLFEQSADAALLVRNHHILDCNEAAMRMIGAREKSELLNKPLNFKVPDRQTNGRSSLLLIQEHEAAVQAKGAHRFEWFRYNLQGEPMWLEITLTNIAVGGEQLIHAVWRDITAQRAAREQLRAEKEFSESLLANSIDCIVALDRQGCVTAWNRQAEHYSGLAETAVLGKSIYTVFPHLDTAQVHAVLQRVLAGEQILKSSPSFVDLPGQFDAHLVPLRNTDNQQVTGVLAIIRDMTERTRLLEEATRLKLSQQQEVLSAILNTQEAERKRIAEALHNGLGQVLYATKLHLERAAATAKRDKGLSLLDEAIKMTRSISFELTPGILEDFGLEYALKELVRRIPRSSIKMHLHVAGLRESLPALLELAVYRMVQELLNNIIKHSEAQEAFVHVVREGEVLAISAEDNGQGFDLLSKEKAGIGIGLPGIRNRVGLLGGKLTIDSRPGQGTIVSVELPVK